MLSGLVIWQFPEVPWARKHPIRNYCEIEHADLVRLRGHHHLLDFLGGETSIQQWLKLAA